MKCLLLADRPASEEKLELLLNQNPDVIFYLGDLEISDIKAINDYPKIPKFGVYGNHESNTLGDLQIQNLHLQKTKIDDFTIIGFEGCLKYKDHSHRNLYTQFQASELIANLPPANIVIAHAPPYGTHDDIDDPSHTGFQGWHDYIERHRPKYFFHGHTYPCDTSESNTLKETLVKDTRVIWSSGANLFEV